VVGPPNGYLTKAGRWPEGPFRQDAPPSVLYAAEISRRLRDAVADSGLNATEVAAGLQIARSTYYDLLSGTTFPDIHTVANAETFLRSNLWPSS
jgi:predicted DNA-binding transcriptional regulator AlpA